MSLYDPASLFRPDDEELAHCRNCRWNGMLGDAKMLREQSPFDETLSGRDGYRWECPRCGRVVKSWYWRIS